MLLLSTEQLGVCEQFMASRVDVLPNDSADVDPVRLVMADPASLLLLPVPLRQQEKEHPSKRSQCHQICKLSQKTISAS